MFISMKIEYVSESLCDLIVNDKNVSIIRIKDMWILTDENGQNTNVESKDLTKVLHHVYETSLQSL